MPLHPTAPPPSAPSPSRKLSVLVVVGTRPEAIKLVPIILALRESEGFRPVVVSTGQHDRMVREVFRMAGIWADVTLWVGDTRSRLNERVANVMTRFEDFCQQWFHDVDGEDATAQTCATGASRPRAGARRHHVGARRGAGSFHLQIPVVHVEAGLRAGSTTARRSPRSSTAG